MISHSRSLFISAILFVLASGAFMGATFARYDESVAGTLILASGFLMMAFLSSLGKLNRQSEKMPAVRFNPTLSRLALGDVMDADFEEVQKEPRWDISSSVLMSEDPTLALAKDRIDIERELRRITATSKGDSQVGLSSMLNSLGKMGTLPRPLYKAVRDIITPLNQAVHGHTIELEVAREVHGLAADIVRYLRSVDHPDAMDARSDSEVITS